MLPAARSMNAEAFGRKHGAQGNMNQEVPGMNHALYGMKREFCILRHASCGTHRET